MAKPRGDERASHVVLARLLEPYGPTGLRPREVERVAAALAPDAELPAAYRAFLRLAGRSCGSLWIGSDFLYPDLLDLRAGTEELLAEDGDRHRLGTTDVPFLLHQGYDVWYLHGPGPDPEVWDYAEGDADAPRELSPIFTRFVADEVRRQAAHAVDSFVFVWHHLRRHALAHAGVGSTAELVRAVASGALPAAATFLDPGDRWEVEPGGRLRLVAAPSLGPTGRRHTVDVDPVTGGETFTAAAVHEATASEDRGRRTVPLVHLTAVMGDAPVEMPPERR